MHKANQRKPANSVKLVVGIDDPKYKTNPEGFCSSDELDWLVAPFCRKFLIPYEREFVSMSVMLERKPTSKTNRRRGVKIVRTADLYGVDFVLKPEVIDEIAVVSTGDFQNLIAKATVRLIESKSMKSCLKQFRKIVGKREERIKLLVSAIKHVKEHKGYAEARLFRPLKRSDCINPGAGRAEGLGDVLFGPDD